MHKLNPEYWEFIAKDTAPFMAWAAGKTSHIYFKFSDDKKLLSLRGDPLPGSSGWSETWKRIEVDRVAKNKPSAPKFSDVVVPSYSVFGGFVQAFGRL